METTEYFSKFTKNISPHGTLAGILTEKLNAQPRTKAKNYYAVTEICNPLHTFYKIKHPEKFKDTPETKKKFSLGNKQHRITAKKFEKIKGFINNEIILDGELLNIPLKGRIDAKINQSIWEVKSKDQLPENINQLIEKYPQDIEQLSFYSLLDPTKPNKNYLIITTHSGFNDYKVFKIKILDMGKIKTLALNRINKLNQWLEKQEPKTQHKCRYCHENCNFKKENICTHFEKEQLPCEVIEFIQIQEAPEIEQELKKIESQKETNQYSIYNLITPRKLIHQEHHEIEEEFNNQEKKQNQELIQDLLHKSGWGISHNNLKELNEKAQLKEIRQNTNSFIKLTSNGKEKIFPVLIHSSPSKYPYFINKVSNYKKAELAIHCLNNKCTKGYLISHFPNQNHEIRVFEISYDFEKGALSKLKKIIEIMNEKDIEKLGELPECPDFIHKNCVYREFCSK